MVDSKFNIFILSTAPRPGFCWHANVIMILHQLPVLPTPIIASGDLGPSTCQRQSIRTVPNIASHTSTILFIQRFRSHLLAPITTMRVAPRVSRGPVGELAGQR